MYLLCFMAARQIFPLGTIKFNLKKNNYKHVLSDHTGSKASMRERDGIYFFRRITSLNLRAFHWQPCDTRASEVFCCFLNTDMQASRLIGKINVYNFFFTDFFMFYYILLVRACLQKWEQGPPWNQIGHQKQLIR